ncbi:flagellar motor protein MotB, partial [Candidatus Dojkabacteria bacterium]|nr:flagellar motor protein MotB [Candidatus Dojkabacteria bacterium]
MAKNSDHFFWISFSDLMTSLFFIMLVLYIISYVSWVKTKRIIEVDAQKYQIIESVENNLAPLKKDSSLFTYDYKYKRYQLAFDVFFKSNKYNISQEDLKNYNSTITRLKDISLKLKEIIQNIEYQKENND